MENLNYIHINNNILKNNLNRKAISPKVNLKVKINSISPKYKNAKFNNNITAYSQQEKINFNFKEENNEKSVNNKIRQLNGYSILALNEDNQYKPSSQYKHNSSMSLKKIQNEIKVIEMKLRSDIIKSKIKQLSDISDDSKHKNKLMYKNNIYNSKSNKIFTNANKTQNTKKFFKINNLKINNINNNIYSQKILVNKLNVNLNHNDNKTNDIESYIFSNKNNNILDSHLNYNENDYISNTDRLYSQQNEDYLFKFNDNGLRKNKRVFKVKTKNDKNKLINSNKKYLITSPSYVPKMVFNLKSNTNTNSNYNNNLCNARNIYNNNIYLNYKNFDKPRSFVNMNLNKNRNRNKNKSKNEFLFKDLPQGFFDNYFINNYNTENTNEIKTFNTYGNSTNENIQEKNNLKIENYNHLSIINQNKNHLQKSFDCQKENRIINFSLNNNHKRKKQINDIDNISISNTINFSLNLSKNKNSNKNINVNNNKENISMINNRENINNLQTKSNSISIDNNINGYKPQKNYNMDSHLKKKDLKHANKINLIPKCNKNNINMKNLKKYHEKNIKNSNTKKISIIDPEELEQKTVILNKSPQFEEKNVSYIDKTNKNKVSFNDEKSIIEYNQNDYIKKSSIYSSNDAKKVAHEFLSTKDCIKKLKKQNNKKPILIDKNKNNKAVNDKNDLALVMLNELISEVNDSNKKSTENPIDSKDNKNKDNKDNINNKESKNKAQFIRVNMGNVKKVKKYGKKVKYKVLSKSEIKLLKNKKNMCYKFKNNPQNFFTEKLCDNVIKSFGYDDNDLIKLNHNSMKIEMGNKKLNKSMSEEFNSKKLYII